MEMLIGVIIGGIFCAAVGAYIGSVKGNTSRGLWLSLLLGPIGWIITAILPSEQPQQPQRGSYNHSRARAGRLCSMCGRANPQGSVKCTECGAAL